VILNDGKQIDVDHLGLRQQRQEISLSQLSLEGTLHEVSASAARYVESRLIQKVLKNTGGNKTKAAEILQVSYKTLLTKIKEYEIEKQGNGRTQTPES